MWKFLEHPVTLGVCGGIGTALTLNYIFLEELIKASGTGLATLYIAYTLFIIEPWKRDNDNGSN